MCPMPPSPMPSVDVLGQRSFGLCESFSLMKESADSRRSRTLSVMDGACRGLCTGARWSFFSSSLRWSWWLRRGKRKSEDMAGEEPEVARRRRGGYGASAGGGDGRARKK